MAQEQTVKSFISGTHNLLPDESIPKDAASDSLNWITKDGHIELMYGRQRIGNAGGAGKNYGQHTGFKVDGTPVEFKKAGTKIQYLNGATWTDVITGLTEDADYVFSNYQSLAGAFVYIFGIDGIYKIATANPGDYTSLYDSAKNFKGFGFIDKGRTILWGRKEDPTGLYGSWIDGQVAVNGGAGVYTSVSNEAIGSSGSITYSGTLAFKAGDAKRTAFGVSFVATVAAGTETFTDNFNGVLTSNFGGTGTINYMTGAYSVTFSAVTTGAVTANYQWEMSNLRGVTDFSKSATRLAGEGFVVRQDAGGDAIVTVLPLAGSYFSLKERTAYRFELDATDLAPVNEIFRIDIGVSSLRSAVGTSAGIIFMNTANPSKPKLHLLKHNPIGDNFDTAPLFPHYKFENFDFSDCLVDTWDRYMIIGCKDDSDENNTLLLCDVKRNSVDRTYYGIRTSNKVNGILHGGDPVSLDTYELFTGFDDLGISIINHWNGNGETMGNDVLKKVKRFRYKGKIDPAQSIKVSISFDDGDFQQIGTILGSGGYVDYSASFAIGTTFIGFSNLGGGDSVNVYSFFMEIKARTQKFRKRVIRFEALGIGFASIEQMTDFDIWTYQQKMPARYRSKQNVSLDGETTDMDNPDH